MFCPYVISTLSNYLKSTVLLPFTVNPLGGLGSLALAFNNRYHNRHMTMPPWMHHHLQFCYMLSNKSWQQNSSHLPFGATYHSWFLWAHQILGENIDNAFSEHLYSSIHQLRSPQWPHLTTISCHLDVTPIYSFILLLNNDVIIHGQAHGSVLMHSLTWQISSLYIYFIT
jgi:hypothetical protein